MNNLREELDFKIWRRVLLGFAIVIAPLLLFISKIMSAAIILLLLWQWRLQKRVRQLLARLAQILLLALATAIVVTQYDMLGISFSFVVFLIALSGAKLTEGRQERDVKFIFLLQLSLLMALLMFKQSPLVFLYMFVAVMVMFWVLASVIVRHSRLMIGIHWLTLLKMLLIALPFVVALFFLFPRIEPIWGLSRGYNSAVTGLPDEMHTGDIAHLVQSNEIAFRVKFTAGAQPTHEQLYWRGLVLWNYDGKKWTQRRADFQSSPPKLTIDLASRVDYEIVLVKDDLQWLPTLEFPFKINPGLRVSAAYQMRLPEQSLFRERRYQLSSALNYQHGKLSKFERQAALQLPTDLNMDKTRALAAQMWLDNGGNVEAFVTAFLNFLRHEEFYYSLEPPPNAGDVDTFLFSQRIGFCEHYASAFTLAARSVGIPTRIVLGYQGGEINSLNDDLLLREEAAHAWTEVWIENRGWQRVDPTAAVSPQRILKARLSAEMLTAGRDKRSFSSRFADDFSLGMLLQHLAASSQAFWQDWVIGLNQQRQLNILQMFGFARDGAYRLMAFMFALLSLFFVIVIAAWLFHLRPKKDKITRQLQRVLHKLQGSGIYKNKNECFGVFLRRAANCFEGEQQKMLLRAATYYEQWRYFEYDISAKLLETLKNIR